MPKTKYGRSTLAGLIDSDSDDALFVERNGMPTPESGIENSIVGKKGRGRPKAAMPSKVTKAKAPARRTSGRISSKLRDVATAKKQVADVPATRGRRKVLADKTNQQHASDTEEVEEFEQEEGDYTMMGDELDAALVALKDSKPKAEKRKVVGRRGKVVRNSVQMKGDMTVDTPTLEACVPKKRGPARRPLNPEQSPEKIVLESQIPEDFHPSDEEVTKTAHNVRRARCKSRTRQPSMQQRRGGSASDTERSDPSLRRKLGDITKKFENLNVKYQDLREIGLKEAERNFERLKKQSDEKTAASEKLISSLKADLASQMSLVKESRGFKKKLETQASEMMALKETITQISASLSEAQLEKETLATKLTANRTAAASVDSVKTKVPESAVKANGGIRMMGTAEAVQVAQAAQLKEDLYSDLTGLIIRNVKREAEDDIFDCIQTGRNGTLHFKLAVANDKSADSYEDAHCQYVPQLDPSRDRALMEILPDYLVEEITFPRPQAARFYARVGKALTEKVE